MTFYVAFRIRPLSISLNKGEMVSCLPGAHHPERPCLKVWVVIGKILCYLFYRAILKMACEIKKGTKKKLTDVGVNEDCHWLK